jgi:two-component system phosphate regulon sensor histidine kinase PhoR
MVIRGNLDLLRLDLPESERDESIRAAIGQAERMGRLVSDLLFLAEADAPETVQREPLALDSIVRAVAERARQMDGDRHRIVVDRLDPTSLTGDPERLEQVVWNLVDNATRYTQPGGQITLSLRRNAARAELSVADTGVGIPAEHQARIFERFYRVERSRSRSLGGTGLGLAIVRQTVEAHGGEVSVQSEPGKGTRFVVALPVDLTSQTRTTAGPDSSAAKGLAAGDRIGRAYSSADPSES